MLLIYILCHGWLVLVHLRDVKSAEDMEKKERKRCHTCGMLLLMSKLIPPLSSFEAFYPTVM